MADAAISERDRFGALTGSGGSDPGFRLDGIDPDDDDDLLVGAFTANPGGDSNGGSP